MEIFVYRKGSEEVETDFAPQDLPKLLADKNNLVWLDINAPTEADMIEADAVLRDVFHFHYLAIEDARETRNQPKIEQFSQYLFFIVHGVKTESNSANFLTKELDGFLGENYLVTYHHEEFRSIDHAKSRIMENPIIFSRGMAYVLHQILDELVDLYLPVVDDFDNAIENLEERIFRMKRGNDKVLEEIMDIKRAVARLRRISAKQLEVFYKMSHGEVNCIDENIQHFYRDIHDHLLRISDLAESYRDLVAGLLDIHFSVIANKTNEITKVLAIFSAIMLPLSVIAGIYGMNFDNMPELHTRNGYFAVIGVMILIAVGLLIYFWKQGWIGQSDFEEVPKELEEEKSKSENS
jgi:magnesium transporter